MIIYDKLQGWNLPEGEKAVLISVSAPYTEFESGLIFCTATFQREDFSLYWLECAWGSLSNLQIGFTYINGLINFISPQFKPLIKPFYINYAWQRVIPHSQIPVSLISNVPFDTSYIDCFLYCPTQTVNYYIPCIEILRSFYATNSLFANSIFSANDLSSYLVYDPQIENNTVILHFTSALKKIITQDDFLKQFALFSTNSTIASWITAIKSDYARYRNISVTLPELTDLHISGKGFRHYNSEENKTDVLLLDLCFSNFTFNFNSIYCTTPKYELSDTNTSNNIHTKLVSSFDMYEDNMQATNTGDIHVTPAIAPSTLLFSNDISIKRDRKVYPTAHITVTDNNAETMQIPASVQPNTPSGNATLLCNNKEFIQDFNKEALDSINLHFPPFGKIINVLRSQNFSVIYTSNMSTFYKKISLNSEYLLLCISRDKTTYSFVLEIRGNCSSTLIVKSTSGEPDKIASKLMSCYSNTGWNSFQLSHLFTSKFHLLRHSKKRNLKTWITLILKYI